jgi:hypothetical protein
MKRNLVLITLVMLGLLVLTGAVTAQDGLPAFSDLTPGTWTQIKPGGSTGCMYDTEFSFFVRPAEAASDKLMVYFQGGGACWDGFTCGAKGQFAAPDVMDNETDELVAGLFDYANPDNPAADYNVVFVPYCTGDIHIGDAEVTFDVPKDQLGVDYDQITVKFNGYNNVSAVLDWTYANFAAPSQVFVTGSSAGGYAATYYAPHLIQHYAGVPLVHLADAATGVMDAAWQGLNTWNTFAHLAPLSAEIDQAPGAFATSYLAATAAEYPDNTYAQYNTFLDSVQVGFFGLTKGQDVTQGQDVFMAVAQEWSPALLTNLITLDLSSEHFYTYMAGGIEHTILPLPQFYTYEVQGLTVRDWVAGLLSGTPSDALCAVDSGECLSAPVAAE